MKVRVIKDFRDRTADLVLRSAEKKEELEVTEERANHLKALGLVEDLPEQEEPEQEEPEQEEPKQEAAKEPPKPRKKKTE